MQPGERDEIQAIRAELDELRTQVDAAGSAAGPSWLARATARPRLAKRLTRMALVALMLALPVMVSASHNFSDVPTSHTFHTPISRLFGARLTTGCSSTKFCPGSNVTRGQMAAFLNRGLGRAADDWACDRCRGRLGGNHRGCPSRRRPSARWRPWWHWACAGHGHRIRIHQACRDLPLRAGSRGHQR